MEQVFKTKWVPDWQYVGMGVAILVVIVVFFWLQEWTALGGLIVPLMLFYSQSKTIYTIKDSGVLEVKSVWGKDSVWMASGTLLTSLMPLGCKR